MATFLHNLRWATGLFLLSFAIKANGQNITNYVFSPQTQTFTLNGVGANVTTLFSAGGGLDEQAYNGIIGFDFWYMGQRYDTFSVSSNGWLTLGSSISNNQPTNNLSSGTPRPIIAPLWDDLSVYEGGLLGGILGGYGSMSYKLDDIVGVGKVMTMQWYRMKWDKTSTSGTGALFDPVVANYVLSFQAKLYENGDVVFVYGENNANVVVKNGSASVGITGTGAGSGNFRSLSDLSSTAAASSTLETNTISGRPANNQSYLFNPTEVAAPTNLNFTNIGASNVTLNWTDNSGTNEIGFVIYRSTDNTNFGYLATTAANATSYNVTGLAANTSYYYRVFALRENLSSGISGSVTTCQGFSLTSIPTGNIGANYRFNGNANDHYGLNNGTLQGGPTPTINRFGVASAAYQFNGTTQYVSTTSSFANPSIFTLSIWFKATVAGGKLIGFGSNQTGFSASADRHIYMANDGKILFGAKPGGVYRTATSIASYNDGNWHMATATMSAAGIVLYVDGVQVGSNTLATSGENYTGYWRIGYDNIDGWPSTPTNRYFTGDLDDVFVYNRALSAAEVTNLYNAGNGVSNNGPVCAATNLTLNANLISGATYSWTGPNGFTSTLRTPSFSYSDAAKGTYTVVVTAGGCSDVASTVVTSTGEGRWTGNVNGSWSTANNWCNGVVPTSTVNVSIPSSGVSSEPSLTTTGSANNISVQSGRILTINGNGNLQVAGAITNAGSIVATSGKVTFNGSTAQIIPANVFSTNTIMDLEVNNTNGVTLNGALRLTRILTATTGAFNANGNLTLASSATSTAAVAPISSGASIIGQVKVERFIQGGSKNPYRGYRMLSSPIYDNTTNFISTNVEGNRTAKFSQLIDDMIMTGAGGTSNGFDPTHNNGTGAWTYNSGFVGVTNINTAVNAGKGMYVLFRGNRDNITAKTVSPYTDVEPIVMDFDGVLNQQDVTVSLNYSNTLGGYNFLGNPYASAIDWDSANWGADKGSVSGAIWMWNPVARGYATYNNAVGTLGGSRYIASGQSFFINATATGTIKFKENIKAAAQQPPTLLMSTNRLVGRTLSDGLEVENYNYVRSLLRIVMKPVASYGEDEMVVVFDDNSSAEYNEQEDALHFDGEMVNISTFVGSKQLAINFLPNVSRAAEIKMNVSSALTGDYTMRFNLDDYHQGQTLILKDDLLGKNIPIVSNGIYNFSIDKNNSQTFGANRFSIIVEPPSVLPVGLLNFTAKKQNEGVVLTWATYNEVDNKLFKLARAGNDGIYNIIGDVLANTDGSYSFLDATPLPGYNYYKLIQVDLDGTEVETRPVVVNFLVGQYNDFVAYPNPVKDKFTVKVDGLVNEKYLMNLYDITGRKIMTKEIAKVDLYNGFEVDVLRISTGLFFVKIEDAITGEIILTHKIVKQ